MSDPAADWTLEEVREWLRDRVDDGAKCPCCTQFAKVYRRKITVQAARVLIRMYHAAGTDWVNLPDLIERKGADEAKPRYWGLLEAMEGTRPDGSSRVGWWRLTPEGVAFVRDELRVPKYARIYDGRCLSLEGDPVGIRDALGTKFRYDELMAGV